MRLQGRDLRAQLVGPDVALLQRELRQLNLAIPDDEVQRSFFGPGTSAAVQEFQRQKGIEDSGIVDEPTVAAINREIASRHERLVRGTVTHDDGTAMPGAAVHAFDRDLRHEETLGRAVTDADGRYEIPYTARQFRRAEKASADLVVRVIGRDGRALLSSEIIFNARPVETVNFVIDSVGARVSEYERHVATVQPLLEGVPLPALDERDIAFLEGETGIAGLHLAFLSLAHRHAAGTKIAAEVFYGLFRQDLPTHLPALFLLPSAQLRMALERSIEQCIVTSRLSAELARILESFRQHAGQAILRDSQGDDATIPRLLDAAGLSEAEQEGFLDSYRQHEGSVESFWRALESTPIGTKVPQLQATLRLGLLARNNAPLVSALHAKGIRSMADLPRLGRDGLRQLILDSAAALTAIEPVDGEGNEQRAARFADGMLEMLRVVAPSAFVRAAYEQSPDSVRRDVARVLTNAPDLELRDADVERFLSEKPGALAGVADPVPVRAHLKRVQRVLRIAPDADHAEVLMAEGLDSAHAVAAIPPDAFAEQFAHRFGGEAQARSYHSKAGRVNDVVTGVVGAIRQSIVDVRPGFVGAVAESVKTLPNFKTLFGSQSFCACTHCSSVLSPAAYLVDLLQFIDSRVRVKPITELRRRRPDIEHIPLTCENTNTPLPYVDLINEVLEYYVANGQLTEDAARDTKGMTAAELNVNPQHVVNDAYNKLATAVYPPILPFHRPLDAARLYLEQIGSSRHELMAAFRKAGQPSEAEIDFEFLRLSILERQILTGDTDRPLGTFYGFPANQNPSNRDDMKAAEFLRRAGTTYEELRELLKTRYLNPEGNISLHDPEDPPQCDLEKMILNDLTPQFWRRAHRFIRLRKKLGWSAADLDRAFDVSQESGMTRALLRKLSAIERLRGELRLPTPVLLSFWGDLDTKGPDSLYARLFLNKAVINPPVQELRVFDLDDDDAPIAEHAASIRAALRINTADFEALTAHLGLAPDATLSLPRLSSLHRHAALARALRLSIKDLLVLLRVSGENPFEEASPEATLKFVELARLVKASGFTVAQLGDLYLSVTPNPSTPAHAVVGKVLMQLREGLQKLADDAPQLLESNGGVATPEALQAALSLVLPETLTGTAGALIEQPGPLDADQQAFVAEHLTFLDPAEAAALGLDATPDARRSRVVVGIAAFLRRDLILETLGESLRLDRQAVSALVETILVSQAEPSKPAMHDLLHVASLPEDILHSSYLRLHKAAMVVREFRIEAPTLLYLHAHSQDFGGIDLNALPLVPGDFAVGQFAQWRRLARYVAFVRALPQRDATLVDVFAATQPAQPPLPNPRDEAIRLLALATEWDPREIDFLSGPDGFNLTADDFRNDEALASLQHCIGLSHRLGVSGAQLFRWAADEPDATQAGEVVSAAKARYEDEQWTAVAKPLNDTLRERSKASLVAYTLDRKNFSDSNQLYEHFLIDVEMSACMKTSRIKQAISSVQLFIQRCLMNLESAVSPSSIDAGQWEWMKTYRVWEANRKVFLYPENWIEPELRDDKSPIFRELESELLQGDLDGYSAEQAFVRYLEKLDRVARLEPCGLYVQEPDGQSEEVVHVFGRTVSEPRAYYYRRFVNGRTWTAWEPVDVDIEGDHLMPIVHDRRLYLFWLRFDQKQNEVTSFADGFVSTWEHYAWLTDHATWRRTYTAWKRVQDIWNNIEHWYRSFKTSKLPPVFDQHGNHVLWLSEVRAEFLKTEKNKVLDDEEPKEPTEPAFSNPPPIVHWSITLNWAEYHRGRWTAKRTSSDRIVSGMVAATFKQFADRDAITGDDREALRKDVATSEATVVAAYLPIERWHFVRTSVETGRLTFSIFRRYDQAVPFLNKLWGFKGHELVGTFSLNCGTKVEAQSEGGESGFSLPGMGFDSLPRPEDTTNLVLSFHEEGGLFSSRKLSFKADGQTRHILTKPISGFRVLYEHAQPAFALRSPYQDFFYLDRDKSYYARYQSEVADYSTAGGGSSQRHHALADSFTRRIGSPGADGETRSGTTGIVVRSGGQVGSAGAGDALITLGSESGAARAAIRAGVTLSTAGSAFLGIGQSGWTLNGGLTFEERTDTGLRFHTFFHPHLCAFTTSLYRGGVPGLLSRETQRLDSESPGNSIFVNRYGPTDEVAVPYPREHVDFGGGAYSLYNWELFFHIPMLVAVSLTKNQRFADALSWFHFVFNPTNSGPEAAPARYWNTLPFFTNSFPENDQIHKLLTTLAERGPGWQDVEHQIAEWLDNPFNPHLIARLRITAYQKNVVMKYIDALIGWGDQLFGRDTIESINEATLMYVLAYNILGPRPKDIPKPPPGAKTYHDLAGELDAFGNALVEAENAFPDLSRMTEMSWASRGRTTSLTRRSNLAGGQTGARAFAGGIAAMTPPPAGAMVGSQPDEGPAGVRGGMMGADTGPTYQTRPDYTFSVVPPLRPSLSAVRSLYFCIPKNEQLLRYWDTVEDRLFKIRNCMNIEGAVRELPLFEPPIDPALLVRAAAAGLSIGSVLNDLFAPLPRYRFSVIVQKAQELCGELKSLGGSLLSALEKRDAEALSNLRARHETALLKEVREVNVQRVAEAKASLDALNKTLEATQHRRTHYENLLSAGLISEEIEHIAKLKDAHGRQSDVNDMYLVAQHLSGLPDITWGSSGMASPVATFTLGGSLLANAASQFAKFFENRIADGRFQAEMSTIAAGHFRRAEEWAFQVSATQREMTQLSRQIIAAEIRQAIAEKELANHDRLIENSEAAEAFLRTKYTSEELYGWMTGQVSRIYFQTYKLATDLAKRAERAYRFELGLTDSNFVQAGYWDNLRKGLLAGEQLSLDLKRMDAAYLEQDRRDYEITKHVSLVLHDPMALIQLRELGVCTFELPETLFDMDYPGHYQRRLKSVSVSIPCVTGPYTSVNCTLTLLSDTTRLTSTVGGADEDTFLQNFVARQSIATSHAQNDAGVFELNFRDERYLPFEGAGAVSRWQLELPREHNAFDFSTIPDVVLHLKYTARDGGGLLRQAAKQAIAAQIGDAATSPLGRFFSLKNEFPTDWHRFLRQPERREGDERVHRVTLDLKERFPFVFRGREIKVHALSLFLKGKSGYRYDNTGGVTFELLGNAAPPGTEPVFASVLAQAPAEFQFGGELGAEVLFASPPIADPFPLNLALEIREADVPVVEATNPEQEPARLLPDAIDDIWLFCEYTVSDAP